MGATFNDAKLNGMKLRSQTGCKGILGSSQSMFNSCWPNHASDMLSMPGMNGLTPCKSTGMVLKLGMFDAGTGLMCCWVFGGAMA